MAMWTSVSVFVEAESVEDINRVVNEIDLLEYYLPKWDVYGTDADSSSLDDIKEGSCDWLGLLSLIGEKMGGRGKAWITEKCDEDYAYTTTYEYENGEITTITEKEDDDDVEEDEDDVEEEFVIKNGVLIRYIGDSKNVVIPGTITEIEDEAFCSFFCKMCLTSVVIPDSVVKIGTKAFYSCGELNSIVIPDSVIEIGELAFSNCSALTSVKMSKKIEFIGFSVFSGCTSLKTISLPENLVIIGDSVFSDCTSLASIKIPGNVTSIGSSAFSSCSALREIELSDSVESIGSFAFSWCGSLTTIKFSNSLKRIDGYAFSNCTSLTSVRIPESVIKIGDKVFSSCDSLTITVTEGSYAEEYCKQNNLSYSIANNLSVNFLKFSISLHFLSHHPVDLMRLT